MSYVIKHLSEKFPVWLESHVNVPKSEFLIPSVVDELVHEGKATLRLLPTDSVWLESHVNLIPICSIF